MSGWKDIDGSTVTAGSPGITDQLDIAFGVLLGEYKGPFDPMSIKKLREICRAHGNTKLAAKCDLAEGLLTAARHLFNHPAGMQTSMGAAHEALALLAGRYEDPQP